MSTEARPRPRRSAGRRQERMAERRRRQARRRRRLAMVGLVVLGGTVAAALAFLGREIVQDDTVATPTPDAVAEPEQDTLLLVRQAQDGGPAQSVTLFATGPGQATAHVLFVPVGTLVDIPGFGLDRLALANQYGGPALLEASLENALGIAIDEVAAVSDSALAAVLGRTGGLQIEVPERLVQRAPDGTAAERFAPGAQFLDGQRLVEYWGFPADDGNELAAFPRQQLVVGALLDALADPQVRDAVVGDGAPQLGTQAGPEWVRDVFTELAAARAEERLSFSLLPVAPFGGPGPDGGATYRLDEAAAADLVQGALDASVPAGGGADAPRVQVLNGVGTPGIGQAVDEALEGGGFRIVRTENASSFDFTQTRILIYDESEASLEAARRVRDLLGVGSIQVSRQPQTLVDLTIVVGADFQPATEQSP